MAVVLIPAPLRRLTGGQSRVEVAASTVGDALNHLDGRHPGIRAYLFEDDGTVRAYVNVFVNQTEIRQREGLRTPVGPSDEIAIIPAMAGGSPRTPRR
jgi:molybdopterin converting factor small subunit